MVKIVSFWVGLPKAKRLSSKSYEDVKKAVDDSLTLVKLSFFSFFASLFQPFLLKYQNTKPMLPYLYLHLVALLKSALQLVVKDDVLEKCSSGVDLLKIDLDSKDILKKREEFHLGFAAESSLRELRKKDSVKKKDLDNFLMGVSQMSTWASRVL